MSSLHCNRHDRLLFIGDSITDAGRTNHCPPLGEGFVFMLDRMLKINFPDSELELLNRGISGNTIEGLKLRWDRHVLNHADALQIRLDSFLNIYTEIISKTLVHLPQTRIMLVTPFFLTHSPESKTASLTSDYIKGVHELGQSFQLQIIDLQTLFDTYCDQHPIEYWCLDGVHPTPPGHHLIAKTLYKYLTDEEPQA